MDTYNRYTYVIKYYKEDRYYGSIRNKKIYFIHEEFSKYRSLKCKDPCQLRSILVIMKCTGWEGQVFEISYCRVAGAMQEGEWSSPRANNNLTPRANTNNTSALLFSIWKLQVRLQVFSKHFTFIWASENSIN